MEKRNILMKKEIIMNIPITGDWLGTPVVDGMFGVEQKLTL